jgi:serine phosphatase RsbU (regulator of sigma subunit)
VDFEVAYMNDRSTDGAGRGAEQLVGRRVLETFPAFASQGLFEVFRDVIETGRGFEDGARRYQDHIDDVAVDGYWALSVQPFRGGYLAASRDVTDEVLANRALAEVQQQRAAVAVLQRVALPERVPDVAPCQIAAHYAPASNDAPVGGDWYDAFRRPNGSLTLLVGDVAGHGPEAAVDMVRLRNMLRQVAHSSRTPAEVLAALNETYAVAANGFATCLIVDIDPTSRTMAWATAGHPPPLVRRAGETHVQSGTPGKPLGVEEVADYDLHLGQLEIGDVLILYTDGLIERRGSSIDVDIEDLARRACAADASDLDAFVRTLTDERMTSDDDSCILVLRCG